MNNKAQSNLGMAVVVAIFIFMIGIMNVNFIKDEVSNARGVDNLNCADGTISDGTKLTCLMVDIVVPWFIITIFAIAGGLITSKLTV